MRDLTRNKDAMIFYPIVVQAAGYSGKLFIPPLILLDDFQLPGDQNENL
jgi:hypothetical protein